MKIAILTQPLGHNYGGLLQAYALQTFITELGVDAVTLDRRMCPSRIKAARDYLKFVFKLIRGRINTIPTEARKSFVLENLEHFRSQKLKMSPVLDSTRRLESHCLAQDYDAYIVGSDQVWRPRYSPCLENFFLDFTEHEHLATATRISYAASFGVDNWEMSERQTARCRHLINRFHAVSVRERSAVSLCREKFGVEAHWVLDPTLLLSRGHYEELISRSNGGSSRTGIHCYLLDNSKEKQAVIQHAEKVLGYTSYSVKPDRALQHTALDDIKSCQYPSIESWLRGFRDADFVITDSFHGTVFAVLFNKPFIAIGNKRRGISRFESLLSLLELDDRLVTSTDDVSNELLTTPIKWDAVNQFLESLASASKSFLCKSLSLPEGVDQTLSNSGEILF